MNTQKVTRRARLKNGAEATLISWEDGPVQKLAQGPMLKATVLWDDGSMKTKTGFIAWVSPTEKKFFDTYEEAWRYAEAEYQKTGRLAIVEAIK